MNELLAAVGLGLIAGLAAGLGGLIAVCVRPGRKIFGFGAGFAAGVMITLALFKLLTEAWEVAGYVAAIAAFTLGAFFMLALDSILPHIRFHVREKGVAEFGLYKIGLLITVGMTLHNIPEGIAVGAGYLHMPALGLFIAIAIAAHNIPEGIAVALPIYASLQSRAKAVKYALLSGLVEPIGVLLAALFLKGFASFVPAALAFVGGVMFFITLDELVPMAREKGHEHYTPFGIILGALFILLLSGVIGV